MTTRVSHLRCSTAFTVSAVILVLLATFVAFYLVDRELLPYDDAILLMRFFEEWQQEGGGLAWLRHIEGETGNVWPFAVLAILHALGIESYATFLAVGQTIVAAQVIAVILIARRIYIRWPYAILAGALTALAPAQLSSLTWAVPLQHSVSILVLLIIILALLNLEGRKLRAPDWWLWWTILVISTSVVWTLREPITASVVVILVVVLVEGFRAPEPRSQWLIVLPLAGGLVLAALGLIGRLGSQVSRAFAVVCPAEFTCTQQGAIAFSTLLALTVGWIVFLVVTALALTKGAAHGALHQPILSSPRHSEVWRGVSMVLVLAASSALAASALLLALAVPNPYSVLILDSRWIVATAPLPVLIAVASACLLAVWRSRKPTIWLLVSTVLATGAIYLSSLTQNLPLWGGGIETLSDPLILARYSTYATPLLALAVAGMWWTAVRNSFRDTVTRVAIAFVLVVGSTSLLKDSIERLKFVAPLIAYEVVYTFNSQASESYIVCPSDLTAQFLRAVNGDFGPRQGWGPLTAQAVLDVERDHSQAVTALLRDAIPVSRDRFSDAEIAANLCARVDHQTSE